MVVLGSILALLGFGLLCWLLFKLAIYALPCSAGFCSGMWSFHQGSSIPGAIVIGVMAAAATVALARAAFAHARSLPARALIVCLFAVPASVAGLYAGLGLAQDAGADPLWCAAFALLGASLVGGAAYGRLAATRFSEPTQPRTANDNFHAHEKAMLRSFSGL